MLEKIGGGSLENEQISLLSSQLESMVNSAVWNESGRHKMIRTANQIKNIIKKPKEEIKKEEVKKFIDVLTKAKVKAVMSNDKNYYTICVRFDSIISNVRKYSGGV